LSQNEEVAGNDEGLRAPSTFAPFNEPRRIRAIRQWRGAPWLAVMAVCFGAILSQVDASIVSLAYPSMQRSFSISIGAVTWVGLSYLLTVIATLVLMGRISDMVGRKLIYLYGFVIFTGASVLCALAPNLGLLVAGRVIQGIGAAMIQANSVAIVFLAVAGASRARALGIQAASQAVGLAIGPTLGGLLLQVVTWRFLFIVNLPIGVIAFFASLAFIPRSRNLAPRDRVDWFGSAYLLSGLGLILVGLSSGEHMGWSSPSVVASLLLGTAILIAFVLHEQHSPQPLISVALLRTRSISLGVTAGALSYFVLYATLFLVPFEVERALAKSSGIAGLVLLGLPGALALCAPIAGRIGSRFGSPKVVVLSGIVMGLGALVLGQAGQRLGQAVGGLVLIGAGIGVLNTLNNHGVMNAFPATSAAVGSGTINTVRGVGTALGLAVGGAVFVASGGSSSVAHNVQSAFGISMTLIAVLGVLAGITGGAALRSVRVA